MHAALPSAYPFPIVIYFHHVGRVRPHYTSLSSADFMRAIELMMEFGTIGPLPIGAVADWQLDKPTFCITLDDGYEESVESVLTIGSALGFTTTFFVVAKHLGRVLPAPWGGPPVRRASSNLLLEAARCGHQVASHSWSHVDLATVTDDAAASELARADGHLYGLGLGSLTNGVVAYPYGNPPRVRPSWVRLGFATVRSPARSWIDYPQEIRRVYLDEQRRSHWKQDIAGWVRLWLESADIPQSPRGNTSSSP
mgnify:CR=1 FL=1